MKQNSSFSELDFPQQSRAERLEVLWRGTLALPVLLFWLGSIPDPALQMDIAQWFLAPLAVVVGCALSGYLLRRGRYEGAVWSYVGGIVLAQAILLLDRSESHALLREIVPYASVPLVFVVGVYLPPRALPGYLALAAGVTVGLPALLGGELVVGPHQGAALVLTGLGALVASQVTGELYAIAEWALVHYRRERAHKLELQQSQLALQKALARAQVLAESLEESNARLERINAELERAWAAAEEAKNFRGQFLANMSHELRTPLNAVIGFSEAMLKFPAMYDDVPLPPEYRYDVEQIHASGTQLLHVINDILDLSKVDAGKLEVRHEVVNLEPIFKATLSMAIGLIGDRPVELKQDLPDELPLAWADGNRIRQVLINLYSNAIKFTDAGAITLGVTTQGDEVIISVSDTGCGIPEDEREVIFEEFVQGRATSARQRTGSGLGLTISRRLVELMGGRIWLESEVGVGTTFYFSLPRASLEAGEAARTPAVKAASPNV